MNCGLPTLWYLALLNCYGCLLYKRYHDKLTGLNTNTMEPEADPDPNQRGGRDYIRGGRDYIRGRGRGGRDYIRGGRRGGRSYLRGGLCPPWPPLGSATVWNTRR